MPGSFRYSAGTRPVEDLRGQHARRLLDALSGRKRDNPVQVALLAHDAGLL